MDTLKSAAAVAGGHLYNATAKGSGVSPIVNRFVNGERGISLETASRLCEYLRIDLVSRRR